jgi:GNAT superfamily N-acetyltransferase
METIFRRLENHERPALAPARAEVWKGPLTSEEFVRRNAWLYAHPFGQNRMRTFGLIEEGKVAASLDALQIALLVGDGKGGVQEVEAWHLASVLTLPENRGRGMGSRLIHAYLAAETPQWNSLFSGIGPLFYEAFGFRATYTWEYKRPALTGYSGPQATEIGVGEFLAVHHQTRRQALQASRTPSCTFHLDAQWWDWYGSIYQFFAEVRGKIVPRGRFWRLETQNETIWVAALENYAAGSLDLWWASSQDPVVLDFLASQAAAIGVPRVHWWSAVEHPEAAPKREVPMIRHAGKPASLPVLDVQMVDWW